VGPRKTSSRETNGYRKETRRTSDVVLGLMRISAAVGQVSVAHCFTLAIGLANGASIGKTNAWTVYLWFLFPGVRWSVQSQ